MASKTQRSVWFASLFGLIALAVIAVTLHAAMLQSGRSASAGASNRTQSQPLVQPPQELVIYCGRSETLVGDVIERFRRETGINVKVKYGNTGMLAALILEEGRRSPADLFFAQDPGGLGLLAERDMLTQLPMELVERVPSMYRDSEQRWVGVTGRLRTVACATDRVPEHERPQSILDLTSPRWRGRVGWAPSNASFQAMVTAMRVQLGEQRTEQWLRGMIANDVRVYPRNTPIIQAVHDGEIDLGLVNHYYLHRFQHERGGMLPIVNHVPAGREGAVDIGGAMLVSGAGILKTARNDDAAREFIAFLLNDEIQAHFAGETFEYPLASSVLTADGVPALDSLPVQPVDLNLLGDLEATIHLLRRVGALR
jgi:iron(III) transport system substrate-binding protein